MQQQNDEELFFGPQQGPEPPKKSRAENPYSTVSRNLNDVERRLRILEERYSNLRRKTQIIDHNMLENDKRLSKEIKTLLESVTTLKYQIQEMTEKLALFNSEFDNLAKKRDVEVIQKYLDLWQPMNFITRDELKEIMEERKK
jgi:chromosome segregation ATPase